MDNRILVVIHDREMRNFVCEELEEYFDEHGPSDLVVDAAKNVKEALKRIAGSTYRTIIMHLHLANDKKSILVEEEMLGLDLLTKIKDNSVQTPCVLLMPSATNDILSCTSALPSTFELIVGNEDWEEKIVGVVQRAIGLKGIKKTPSKINLDIFVDAQQKNWMMVANGVGDIICDPKPHVVNVNIDMDRVLVAEESVEMLKEKHPHWEYELQQIGENLVRQIMENNPDTKNFYRTLKGKAGGNENFNIRFTMDKNDFVLPVEAILEFDYRKHDDFWMLKAPICRRLHVEESQNRWPLFEDERQGGEHQPINCLIIEANVEGYNDTIGKELENLVNVKKEADDLVELLEEKRAEYHIGEIKRLPDINLDKNLNDPCSPAKVKEILTGGKRWDLVHYAGHSYHNDNGYVFFPDSPTFAEVEIKSFAKWLWRAKTRLIYLSSCKSSKVKFVHELAETGVPSVLGFRWDIHDKKAAEHAKIFYEQLFAERSLEYAFLKTRQKVHANNPEHIIWASPVLVMQARR